MFRAILLTVIGLLSVSCSIDSAKNHYILAEKLWNDGNYHAAVAEFEKVSSRDPKGKLGQQALFRAAMTQTLYLSNHADAVRKFQIYSDTNPGSAVSWEAEKQIGEILFYKTEQYDKAIQQYRKMIKLNGQSPDVPECLFRIAKSQFYLWQFEEAIASFQDIKKRFPQSPWAEKASYEIGMTYFTRGEHRSKTEYRASADLATKGDSYQEAIDAFETFFKVYPKSELTPLVKFGIASALEELDQLDAAYAQYEAIRSSYPAPKVIEIKLARIRERKAQRRR